MLSIRPYNLSNEGLKCTMANSMMIVGDLNGGSAAVASHRRRRAHATAALANLIGYRRLVTKFIA